MTLISKPIEKNAEGKYIVPLILPDWLVRKISLEVRSAKEQA